MPYIELVRHPENEALAYQRKHDGEIICTYIGFNAKARASSWQLFVETMTDRVELRPATRMSAFKYELKIKGLSQTQIDRLASEVDTKKTYHKPWDGESKPPEGASKHVSLSDRIKPGVKVVATLTPSETFEATSTVGPDNRFFAKSLLDDRRQLLDVEAVTIVEEKPPTQYAKILLKDSEYYGQTLPISRVSPNEMGYTVELPSGDNHWFRADGVTIVDSEIEENASPTDPVIEFNDLVQITSDRNDCVGLVGAFGRVKTVKGARVGVEVDEQLVYFDKSELLVKAKAEAPKEQLSQLQSGQVLLGNRIVTNGNYIGCNRRNAISNARRGTANKLAALELVKAGLSPTQAMAAATGTDDASDF